MITFEKEEVMSVYVEVGCRFSHLVEGNDIIMCLKATRMAGTLDGQGVRYLSTWRPDDISNGFPSVEVLSNGTREVGE